MILEKNDLRRKYIKIRNSISISRKTRAKNQLLKLGDLSFSNFLSFASKKTEIDLWSLNEMLAKEKRLFLPRVSGNNLDIYLISDLKTQLIKGHYNILEPDPTKCTLVEKNLIACILVPGIVFDQNNYRIGYGKGYYDILLKNLSCTSIGIGYIEQLTDQLPTKPHDVAVKHLFLF